MAKIVSFFNTPAREVSTCQCWRDQLGQVSHTGDLRIEERGHKRDLTGQEVRRADAIPHLSEHQGLAGEPGGTGRRCQPRDELVMDAERVQPA
jgi:hypothetical protein